MVIDPPVIDLNKIEGRIRKPPLVRFVIDEMPPLPSDLKSSYWE